MARFYLFDSHVGPLCAVMTSCVPRWARNGDDLIHLKRPQEDEGTSVRNRLSRGNDPAIFRIISPFRLLLVYSFVEGRYNKIKKEKAFGRLARLSMTLPCVQGGIKQKAALWPEEINSAGIRFISCPLRSWFFHHCLSSSWLGLPKVILSQQIISVKLRACGGLGNAWEGWDACGVVLASGSG